VLPQNSVSVRCWSQRWGVADWPVSLFCRTTFWWFDVRGSVQRNINRIEKKPTRCDLVVEFIIPVFPNCLTCFGRHTAHHQELKNCNCSLWFYIRFWLPAARGLCVGRYPFTTCFVTGPTPTPSPSLLLAQAIFEPKLHPYGYPNILKFSHSTPTCLWRWNRQSVPKRRHIKFRRRGITQKKTYNMSSYVRQM
jgi:hypothetical protein